MGKKQILLKSILLTAVLGLGIFARAGQAQAACPSGTCYAHPNGGGDVCSNGAPCKLYYAVNTKAVGGDTILLKDGIYTHANSGGAGVYSSEYVLRLYNSTGSVGAWITIKAENKWMAVLDGENVINKGINCGINAVTNYIRIEDIDFTRFAAGAGVYCANSAAAPYNSFGNYWIIKGNRFHHIGRINLTYRTRTNGGGPIFMGKDKNHWIIDSNIMFSNGALNQFTDPPFSGSPSDMCTNPENWDTWCNITAGQTCPDSCSTCGPAGHCQVNTGETCPADCATCYAGINGNPCTGHDHAMYLKGTDVDIVNNLIYDHRSGYGIKIDRDSNNVSMVNNTIVDENPVNGGQVIFLSGPSGRTATLENNIFSNAVNGVFRCLEHDQASKIVSNNLLETGSNWYSTTSSACKPNDFTFTNNIDGNPNFTDASGHDYTLQSSSDAINKLNPITAPAYDIASTGRPQGSASDIGAYEYVPVQKAYYASPNGSGSGLSESSPFKIADFWTVAKPGDTLYLLDGIYQGDKSMISPPYNYNSTTKACISYGGGEDSQPVTIKALNDGKVTIDGQGQRKPVYLLCQKNIIIEGINAHDSSGTVFSISRSDNNVIRRSIGWDAYDGNQNIFGIHGGENNLLEDVAGFGIARKIFSSSQFGNHTTIRRAWGSWDGSHEVGPKMTYTMAYNNYDMTCENCIGTWTGYRMKESYALKHENNGCYTLWSADQCASNGGTLQYAPEYSKDCCVFTNHTVSQPYAVIGVDQFYDYYDNNARSQVLGSIAYVKTGNNYHVPIGQTYLVTKMNSFEYKDNVAYVENSSRKTFLLSTLQGGGGTNLFASNLTGVGGSGASIHSDWQKSNIQEGPDAGSVGNVFTSPNGARLCKRYKDRVLTNEPLWPWPMNQRIIDATIYAGREVVDVTATIEELFGPIPEDCAGGEFIFADVNSDGRVNIKDIQEVIRCIINSGSCAFPDRSDVNGDGSVNIKDIQEIIREITA